MPVRASFYKKVFHFNFDARTSRGVMKDKSSWFLKVYDESNPGIFGVGECGPLPGLSREAGPDFEAQLKGILDQINGSSFLATDSGAIVELAGRSLSSIIFGLETALRDLQHGGKRIIFDNGFLKGQPIPINGLIWMGDMDFMMDQINKKIAQGFRCVKLKVGGLDFDRECDILSYIRKRYFREKIVIRLDANGAMKTDEVLYKLDEMAKHEIHSIEQPIQPGMEEMEELCRKSPIPVVFDEELIGIQSRKEKIGLLERLKPQFIVLKPTLHGGLKGCEEWIDLARSRQIGWWITSALESSVGLNAICQFVANYDITIHQGLGTGTIYRDNYDSPLKVKDGNISYDSSVAWSILS